MTESESENLYRRRPCDECRERKRKCSFGEPCERCGRLNRQCVYTLQPSPKDREYLRELEQMNEIKALQQQLRELENEVGVLKVAQEKAYLEDYPSPLSDTFNDSTSTTCYSSSKALQKKGMLMKKKKKGKKMSIFESSTSDSVEADDEEDEEDEPGTQPQKTRNHLMIAQSNQYQVFLNKNQGQTKKKNKEKPWSLSVQDGNMVVKTFIKTHSDLLRNLENILCEMKTSTPPSYVNPVSPDKSALTVICAIAWKRYGKTRFEVLTHCAPVDLTHNPNAEIARFSTPQDLLKTTMKIIHAYFECHHLIQFIVHRPTFVKLFMRTESGSMKNILKSPAVMSICGTVCLYACKHIGGVLPFNSLTDFALLYFEQTKELIEDRFDECSLELMCAYTLLGTHKIKVREDDLGMKYIELARRIYDVLEPKYKQNPASGEYTMTKRLYRLIHQANIIVDVHYHMKYYEPKFHLGPIRFFNMMDSNDEIDITPAIEETETELSYIKVRKLLSNLRKVIREAAAATSSNTLSLFVDELGHKFEMSQRHWYRHVLPEIYQLSLPLFDDQVPDLDFFTVLEKECGDSDALRLLPVITVYNEYMVMARAYMPSSPENMAIEADAKLFEVKIPESEDPADVELDERWKAVLDFIPKYQEISPFIHDHSVTQHELIDELIKAVRSNRVYFDIPLAHVAVSSAFNMVRLLQFIVSRSYTCFLDMRWLLNTWEILLRAARFKYQQPNDKDVTMNRLRANMYILLDVVDKHVLNARFDIVKNIFKDLNSQLEEVFGQ